MLNPEKLFTNVFSDKSITSPRLVNFSHDLLSRLTAGNSSGSNTALINLLSPALENLKAELGETDTALGIQKNKTLTVNQFREQFNETIGDFEGAVSLALGGSKNPSYQEFFPYGLSEYTSATVSKIPFLLSRLSAAALKYTSRLGTSLSQQLQDLEGTWLTLRHEQVQQKANVSDSRTGRQDARKAMETVLLQIVYTIGLRHPGKMEECMATFNFSLLQGQTRKKKKESDQKVA